MLHVPDTHDRYYVLQFIDAWTNNFAYIGRRATGTAEAEYLLTDRDDDGPVPDGMRVVAARPGCSPLSGGCSSTARPTYRPSTPSRTSSPSPPGSPDWRRSPGRGRRRPPARSARPRGAALVGTVPGGSGGVPPTRRRQAVRDPGRAVRGDHAPTMADATAATMTMRRQTCPESCAVAAFGPTPHDPVTRPFHTTPPPASAPAHGPGRSGQTDRTASDTKWSPLNTSKVTPIVFGASST